MDVNRNEFEDMIIKKKERRRVKFIIALTFLISLILTECTIAWAQNNDTSVQDETETSKVLSELLKDTLLLVAGGFIGVFSSLGTSFISHRFKMQEEQIKREFEVRKEKTDFFCSLYGYISTLSELMDAYKRTLSNDNAGIISEDGFVFLNKQELYDKFKKEYALFSSFFYQSRKKGYEMYFPIELANNLTSFWSFTYKFNKETLEKDEFMELDDVSEKIMGKIEGLLGLLREK